MLTPLTSPLNVSSAHIIVEQEEDTVISSELFSPLRLRSGRILGNRIAKAAMEEGMAGDGQLPDRRLLALYRRWGAGGAGLLITGNVMVHAEALTGPGGVVLDDASPLEPFAEWAQAGKAGGAAMWMQINHPGRQVQANMPGVVWGPSAVGVELGKHSKRFGRPVAMTPEQIEGTVARFQVAAARAERAGFDGVEVHAAHGYLLSQFLSPLVNKRTDEWGGSLENRARMLLGVVRAVRAAVSPSFAVAVKLNSADFQRGGFDIDDARRVIAMLEPLGVDLVELSGGSYESPAMSGRPADARTQAREAYFLEVATDLVKTSPLPLMLTGGITRRETAHKVLASGVALIGMGTALAVTPDLPYRWREGREADGQLRPVAWSDKTLASAAGMAVVRRQMRRIVRGLDPSLCARPALSLVADQLVQRRALRRYRSWLRQASAEPVSTRVAPRQ
jgi:2,4-dienoyl-CoA reductase-like NADH-dependent reductase (Old Yellow Enzyme family)